MGLALRHRWQRWIASRSRRPFRTAVAALAAIIGIMTAFRLGITREADAATASNIAVATPAGVAPSVYATDLVRAFAASFGAPDATVRSGGALNEATRFTPGALLGTSFGPILISEGEVLAPRPHSQGKLAVIYMTADDSGLRPRAAFVPAIESGSFGRLDHWRVRHDLSRFPVIEIRGHSASRGYHCSTISLLELQPDAPVLLATIAASFDDSESVLIGAPTKVSGQLAHASPAGTFDMVYSGSASFSEHYVRRGSGFALQDRPRTRMRSC